MQHEWVHNPLMCKTLTFVAWLVCCFVTVGQAFGQPYLDGTPDGTTYTDPDVYSVYSAVINSIFAANFHQPDTKIYIGDHTATGQDVCSPPNKEHQAMLAPALADYEKTNKLQRHLLPRFSLEKPYEVVRKAPQGAAWIYLSSVGFNSDKTLAVVSAISSAGSGTNYVLIKKDGAWQFLTGWSDYGCAWAS